MKKATEIMTLAFLWISSTLWAEPITKMNSEIARQLWAKSTVGQNVALHGKVIYSQTPNYDLTSAGGTDTNDLTDGVLSDISDGRIWFDSKAVGWYESGASGGFNILLDLGKVQPIDHAVLRAAGGRNGWCFLTPQRFEVYISKNGTDFYPVAILDKLKPGESSQSDWLKNYYVEENGTAFVFPFDFKMRSEARYIGFSVYGETDAVFMDEIAVMVPQAALTSAEISAPYRAKASEFYTSGLVVAPRIGKLVISSNIHTPNYFMAKDMRPGKKISDPLHLTVEVPANVDVVFPTVENRENFKVDDCNYQKLTFTVGKSPYKIPFTNEIFFTIKGDIFAGATVTIYDADNKVNPVRQTFPIEIIKIPEVAPQLRWLQVSLSWMDEGDCVNWPNFMKDWKKLGFNAVGTFPRYYEGRNTKIQKFLSDARNNGYKIIMQETPCLYMGKDQKPGGESFSQVSSNDSKNLCPTYRGEFYQKELERVRIGALACRPDYVYWDIEIWQEGGDDGLAGRCGRCRQAITASGKSAADFLKDSGTDMYRDAFNAVKAASVEGGFPMPLIASYNHHAVTPVHQVVTDFDRIYPRYVKQAQPSLYVGGRAAMVHNSIRGNYLKLKNRDVLPWLSAGQYGELEPRKLEQEILEALLNGSIGFTYYWNADFDTPLEYYYHARPLAALAPYEELLMNGRVLDPTGSNTALYYSGIGHNNEMLLLIGNYDMVNESTVCQVPAGLKSAKDLFSSEKLKITDGKLALTVPKDGIRLMYCSK